MAELSYIIRDHYPQVIDTLKNTSHDKENDVYLCKSQLSVVDFDQLTKILYPKQQPASFDASPMSFKENILVKCFRLTMS